MQQTPSSFGQRIKAIRRHAGLSQRDFGKKIGLSGNRVSEIEHEKGGMSAGVLFSISREFHVDSEWLMTGEGRMMSAAPQQPETTSIEARLHRIETKIEKISQEERLQASPIATIPIYLEAVAAGYPNSVRGDIEEQIDIPASWTHGKKQLFALRVSGESMTGIGIMPGDTLVVESKQMAKDRQVVIASINGEMTVKTLSIEKGGTIRLLPENPAYNPIPVTSDMDFRIHGIVIAALRSY
ncbi:MAG: helix-turn-helix domain-containing protein [Chlorobium sp.]|jgi:SOS regulatory protein LexA|uniref:helix-turn-helix domain-containing protein n=1 Tax=Chlorobium sp. TaxID=1095 RepID=UPI0025C4AD87|nr:S24 family peptidase [Chlorobium sp.]MCF8217234.1 helix-turn-helix domain-containing protein [Chlorobium sp.]MCF8272092.1 helix-turn-helix domain-containing protein [Chlorobium sp.]MCF8288453.1 helix-turn-helix domain-containing protein [Chlorobium sp.]MCF8292043.1 helix-turn-helix domain-containing protein [Chlorobium sp.]MCF8386145.1 helix-turn-helix domain-containing protein [Chlorobium sp.]